MLSRAPPQRLARIFKLLKMGKASASIQLVSSTAGAAMVDSISLLSSLVMVTCVSMIIFSAVLAQVCISRLLPPTPAFSRQLPQSPATPRLRPPLPAIARHLPPSPAFLIFSAVLAQIEPGNPSDSTEWFLSIPRTVWWSLVTLTGVGYGDEVPRHAPGMIVAVICGAVYAASAPSPAACHLASTTGLS